MPQMRLDKLLSHLNCGSRKEVQALIRAGRVSVDGTVQKDPAFKVDPDRSQTAVDGTVQRYRAQRYYMLNKPMGVITASRDERHDTVLELFPDELARSICSLVAVSINNIKTLYDEKHDKATFVKNIILDNILPGDIYIKSRELHFGNDVPRVVFLVRQQAPADVAAIDVVNGMFPDKQKDFVLHISETDIVVVKEVKAGSEIKDLVKLADSIEETLLSELSVKCLIGIGSVSSQMKDIAKSFKEATTAIEVGAVFDTEKNIISFENLGIGRLIYQLPITLCEMFLSEVFRKGSIDSLDQETLFTIQKFFENNLNVSETSRKLFVHRNTLVYRLEKIKKLTGLDLREFDHAIVFKVALMVRKYLASREEGTR